MSDQPNDNWFYVIVQNPGTPEEQIMGFEHEESKVPFIPAFSSKEISQQCFLLMPKDVMNNKYEPQAIIREDLIKAAGDKGYGVYLLDDKGCIIKEIS